MAEAIISAVVDAGIAPPENITVGEPVNERRNQLTQRYGLNCIADNRAVVNNADLVVLAVKPQHLADIFRQVQGHSWNDQVVLSIVAGAKISTLATGLNHPLIIRVIPNTPAQVRAGMCVWTAAPSVGEEQKSAASKMLRTLGKEVYVEDEKLIDMATALSASGPAYVFMFVESMIDAGVYLGMSRDTSRTLVLQTLLGSVQLLQESDKHPAELSNLVTSPGGTTAEALRSLEADGLRSAVLEAIVTAYQKSKALGDLTDE